MPHSHRPASHTIPRASPRLGRLLCSPLGLFLQLRSLAGAGRRVVAVRPDGLLAVRRQLWLPVALALLLLGERVGLVLIVVGAWN